MELRKNTIKILVLSIILLFSLYLILNYDEESTNQEAPKKATFVYNLLEEDVIYGRY